MSALMQLFFEAWVGWAPRAYPAPCSATIVGRGLPTLRSGVGL